MAYPCSAVIELIAIVLRIVRGKKVVIKIILNSQKK